MTSAAPAVAAPAARPTRRAPVAGKILSSIVLLLAMLALVAVAVAAAGGTRVRVEQTGSMAPALHPGDLVLVRSVPVGTVSVGDVIGVRRADGPVIVHRVERIDGGDGFLRVHTRGDANPTGEDWQIPRGADVALVTGSIPKVGAAVDAVKGPVAAIAVLLAALILAVSALRSVWKRG